MVEGSQTDSRFGYTAATAGDVDGDGAADLVIGAYKYDHGETDEGSAFLYPGTPAMAPAGGIPADVPLLLAKGEGESIVLGWGLRAGRATLTTRSTKGI